MNFKLYNSLKNATIRLMLILPSFYVGHLIGSYGFGLESSWTQIGAYNLIMYISIFFITDVIVRYFYLNGEWR